LSASRLADLRAGEVRRALFPSFRPEPALTDADLARVGGGGGDDETPSEKVRREALEAGSREGRAAAYAEWTGRLGEVAAALEQAGRLLLSRRAELAEELDRGLPRLVLALTRRVIEREVAADDPVVAAGCRNLGERLLGKDQPVAVRLHPRSAETFEAWRRQAGDLPLGGRAVTIEADPALALGDWMLDTGDGVLDGRIDSQLDEAWRLVVETPA
jgi:flagellar biosynthesis/type III secretory pathway protein FliH